MSFIAKNPLTVPEIGNTPPPPIPNTRGLYAKDDGWYDIDSNGKIQKVVTDIDRNNSYKYYGDAGIVPSNQDLFDFVLDENTKTATLKRKSGISSDTILDMSGDIVIPFEYLHIDGEKYIVTALADYALQTGANITSVTIPNTVTTIGGAAFENCIKMTNVIIPNSVISIGSGAFVGCSQLNEITLPEQLTTIAASCFMRCSNLKKIRISDAISNIENRAFYSLSNLSNVYYSGTEEQWNSIIIAANNESLSNANIHYQSVPATLGDVEEKISNIDLSEISVVLKDYATLSELDKRIQYIDLTTDDEDEWTSLPDLSNEILNYGIYQVRWTSSDYLGREVTALVICSSDPASEILYLFYEASVYVMPMGMGDDWHHLSYAYTLPEKNKLNTLPTNEKLTEELSSKVPIIRIEDELIKMLDDEFEGLNNIIKEGVYIILQDISDYIIPWTLYVEYSPVLSEVRQYLVNRLGQLYQRHSGYDGHSWDSWTNYAVPFTPSQSSKLNTLPTNEKLTEELSSKVPIIRIYDPENDIVSDAAGLLDKYTDPGFYVIIQDDDVDKNLWILRVTSIDSDYSIDQYLTSYSGNTLHRRCDAGRWRSWENYADVFSSSQNSKLNALPTNAQLNKKFADEQAYMQDYVANELATFDFIKVVDALPEEGLANRIYFVPKADAENQDLFDEYAWVNGEWEWITTKQMEIDLTGYVQKSAFTYDSETKTLIIDM